jgi:hypothetical protein
MAALSNRPHLQALPAIGLNGFGPCRLLGARGHPGIIFGRAAPGRHANLLASHPLRHIGDPLADRRAGASRQQNTGKTRQDPFELWQRGVSWKMYWAHNVAVPVRDHGRDGVEENRPEGKACARRPIAERSRSGVGKRRRPAIRPRGGAALV